MDQDLARAKSLLEAATGSHLPAAAHTLTEQAQVFILLDIAETLHEVVRELQNAAVSR